MPLVDFTPLFSLIAILQVVWMLFLVATHISLTIIVYRDARSLPYPALGISPFLWLGIAFSLPIVGMFICWVMNYSSLSKQSV